MKSRTIEKETSVLQAVFGLIRYAAERSLIFTFFISLVVLLTPIQTPMVKAETALLSFLVGTTCTVIFYPVLKRTSVFSLVYLFVRGLWFCACFVTLAAFIGTLGLG